MQTISMSAQELDRHGVIARLRKGELNGTEAARLLKLSVRQIRRLKHRVSIDGAGGLVHALRGKPGNRRLDHQEREKITTLLHKHYPDFKPTFAAEKLLERHSIAHDPKTIRSIMMKEGLWKPRKAKARSTHRAWRQRKSCYGEMIQYDGSYEYWFEDRGGEECLLAGIDDATGKITKAEFAPHEGLVPTFTFWKSYLETHGRPRAIYTDKFSTYAMNSAIAKENEDLKTQFGRVCEQLHIELIHANSPQAKGRVEILFLTLQDRLIKELRLAGISTVKEANIFLKEVFIHKFNARFAVEPPGKANLHVVLKQKDRQALPSIFSRHETRTVQNDFTFSFKNQWYQLLKNQPATVCKKDVVIIEERLDGTIHVTLRGKELNANVLPVRPKKAMPQPWVLAKTQQRPNTPAANHPWRKAILRDQAIIQEARTVLIP